MLGVNVGTEKPRDTGVEIVGVSPGGPAELAGLRPADVIVAIDGKPLKRAGDETPANQLVEHLTEVEPGTTVKIDYLRGDKRQSATVKTKAAEPPFFTMFRDRFDACGRDAAGRRRLPLQHSGTGPASASSAGRDHAAARRLLRHGEGSPVVRAPGDSAYQLQDGDVLMGIDGRVPESPGHAFRILRSYQPGEKLKLDVLRNRKRVEVSVTMPAERPMHGAIQLAPQPAVRPLPPMPAVPVPPPPSDDGPV
jgi:S1-C subfamily serine protease